MSPMLLMNVDVWSLSISAPVALASVAVLGYLVGRRSRIDPQDPDVQSRREIKRAQEVAKNLEGIAQSIRKQLAKHHGSVARFKDRVAQLSENPDEAAWKDLCQEAESILSPTLQLAAEISYSYDQIRQQSNQLMTFTEVRTDPLTGVSNRRAMDDTLGSMAAMKSRYQQTYSLAMFDIDHFKKINDNQGHLAGDHVLKEMARVLDEAVRETDIVTRYGGEEFVIIMPKTDLSGACVFAERTRRLVEQKLSLTISGGVATAMDGETPDELLERADAALYSAKTAGRNRIFRHTGRKVEPAPQLSDDQLDLLAGSQAHDVPVTAMNGS